MQSDLTFSGAGRVGTRSRTENKRGSDCSGTDGTANRVLTLANTQTSASEFVIVQGTPLHVTVDYTVTHSTSSSTITFLNIMDNDMYIAVRYFV